MKTRRTTLSFLTESKASHVSLLSIRRVAITLLVMLLTTASVWAQEGPVIPTPKIYTKVTPENGGEINDAPTEAKMGTQVQFTVTPADGYKIKNVSLSDPSIYNLAGSLQTGLYSFTIGSADVTIEVVFEEVLAVTFNANGGIGTMLPVIVDKGKQYTIPDCSFTNPNNQAFIGWSTSATGDVQYRTNDQITLTGNLTLYAIWEDTPYVSGLKYSITDEVNRQVMVTGYEEFPTGTLNIPATITIKGTEYSVTSIGEYVFYGCFSLRSVTIPNSVTSIGEYAFKDCSNLQSVTINGNLNIGDAFSETPATVTMNLTASEIDGDYWTTFYNDNWEYNFEADGNTTVYKGMVNESSLMLTEVEDKIVNSGTAVILKSSGNPVMTLTESGSSDTNGNDLQGISERQKRTSVISDFNANEIYTMGNTLAGFGFHRYTGEYVPAGKAFLPLNTSNGAKAQSLTIVFAIGATGIKSVSSDSNVQNDWFSLDGTRLSGKPSQPGIYVNGKKKIVIK